MRKISLLTGVLATVLGVGAIPYNEVTVDYAVKAETEPVLDGRLDEPVWQTALVRLRFYEYYKSHPKEAPIKSELRLLYTDSALWIGLVHYEAHPDKLKVVATARDGVDWYEDMDEIYIDPFGDAIGFTKLLVNSAGVLGDMRRIDGSVVQNEWNGTHWAAKTHVGVDRWTMEACVPYADLQLPPEPGVSLWRFCVTRYQWTSGKFVGSVSSPGGAYNNPSGFGYLCFLPPGAKADADLIARSVGPKLTPPWCVELPGVLLRDAGKGLVREKGVTASAFLEAEAAKDAENERMWNEKLERDFGGNR